MGRGGGLGFSADSALGWLFLAWSVVSVDRRLLCCLYRLGRVRVRWPRGAREYYRARGFGRERGLGPFFFGREVGHTVLRCSGVEVLTLP